MTTEKYNDALDRYNELLKLDPENANLHFLAGYCCLNINGIKEKAIPYRKYRAGTHVDQARLLLQGVKPLGMLADVCRVGIARHLANVILIPGKFVLLDRCLLVE